METKSCPKCGLTKPLDEFWKNRSAAQGRQAWCKGCMGAATKAYAKNRPELYRAATRRWSFKRTALTLGLDAQTVAAMYDEQGNVCAICGQPESATQKGRVRRLSIDHDHATGRIRGLLCSDCNRAVGLLRDDPETVRRAAAYLELHRGTSV